MNQNERLRFKQTEKGDIQKYSAREIKGFEVDTFKFNSLTDIEIYGDSYPLLGKTSTLKQSLGSY